MINLTDSAINYIKECQKTEGHMKGLKIAVAGGGCSGLSYRLDFLDNPETEDKVFEQNGVKVFVDPKSYVYLKGLTLDYSGGLQGSGFTFVNPNAKKSCGCGSSFGV